jgi:hypothetical protein
MRGWSLFRDFLKAMEKDRETEGVCFFWVSFTATEKTLVFKSSKQRRKKRKIID